MSEQTQLWKTKPNGRPPERMTASTSFRIAALTGACALLIGLVVGPVVSGKPVAAVDPSASPEHTISVSGIGLVSTKPDVADIVIGVSAEKSTAKEARNAAAGSMTQVIAAAKKNGVADKDIVTTNVSLDAVYDYSSQKARLTGYRFTNNIKVTVRNLDSIAAVVDDAVSAGATQIYGISFRLGDPKSAQAQARQAAMDDARSKADALAKAGGVTIKGVATISETSYMPPTPVMYDSAKYAAGALPSVSTPIQTGTTDVQVQVQVTYLIG